MKWKVLLEVEFLSNSSFDHNSLLRDKLMLKGYRLPLQMDRRFGGEINRFSFELEIISNDQI
jgi:hypothetical protein